MMESNPLPHSSTTSSLSSQQKRGHTPHHPLSSSRRSTPLITSTTTTTNKRQKKSISRNDNIARRSSSLVHAGEGEEGDGDQMEHQSPEQEQGQGGKVEREHEQGQAGKSEQEQVNATMSNTRISFDDLGFEILDTIFSYFSNPASSDNSSEGHSHYENQQNLLAFCQVNRAFYNVARLHLSRYIPIASTFKARQLLSLCHQSSEEDEFDPFGARVHSLLLLWPDQGKYSTRRTSVITQSEFHQLLSSFPSLRTLELVCLPYTRIEDDLILAKLASSGAMENIRSLSFTNTPFLLSQREDYKIVTNLLGLVPRLEHLSILNMPLNSLEGILDIPKPTFRLKSLSIKISSARVLEPDVLEWILESTIQAQTCLELTIWLSKKCTDRYNEYNTSIQSVKEEEGFQDIQEPLSKLSPSLRKLSLLGLRTGQSSTILSKTTDKLKLLQIYDTFGFGSDLLGDLPLPTGLERLEILPNPNPAFGAPVPEEIPTTSVATTSNRGRNTAGHNGARSTGVPTSGPATGRTNGQANSTGTPAVHGGGTTATISTNADNQAETNNNHMPHTFTEIPISSQSFIQELSPGNRLERLKSIKIPDNARFGKRGKWINKELLKACRKYNVIIEEISSMV